MKYAYKVDLSAAYTAEEREEIQKIAPIPTAETNGTVLKYVATYGEKSINGKTGPKRFVAKVVSGLGDAREMVGQYFEFDKYGETAPIALRYAPVFKMVALDQTEFWDDATKSVTGRIQEVYLYDEASVTHLCEITPSYALRFMYNIAENPIGDDPTDEYPMVPGFDSATEFERQNGGEDWTYMHATTIDRTADRFKYACEDVTDDDEVEIYRCAPDHLGDELYDAIFEDVREHFDCNRSFEGHFDPEPAPVMTAG